MGPNLGNKIDLSIPMTHFYYTDRQCLLVEKSKMVTFELVVHLLSVTDKYNSIGNDQL